jgi:lipopolysaccharide exporter
MKNSNSFIKGFVTLFSGNVVAQIIPFLFAPILSRIFTNEEFAIQANFIAIVGIISIVAGGRYELALVLPKTDRKAMNLLGLSFGLIVIISILSFSILLLEDQIVRLYETSALNQYLILVPIGVFINAIIALFLNWLVRTRKYHSISLVKIVQSVSVNMGFIILGFFKFGTSGLIWGWILGLIVTAILLFYSVKKDLKPDQISKKDVLAVSKEYKDFPLVNSLHAFSDLFFSQFILFLIITKEFGLVPLGLFFMMNKYLKAPIRVIGSAVGQVYYKEANDQRERQENVFKTLMYSVKLVAVFAVPICLVILLFGPEIFQWYLGADWRQSGVYAQIMAVPILFNFLVSPISSTTLIYKKQKTALLISLIGYAASVIALEIGVYLKYSFDDALKLFALSMSLYYIVLLLWYIYLTKKK